MLLERVGCLNFKVNFQKIFLFYVRVLLCSKVGDNGDFVFLSGSAMDKVLNPVPKGSILSKIILVIIVLDLLCVMMRKEKRQLYSLAYNSMA